MVTCQEQFDVNPSNIEDANKCADIIENLICDMSDVEKSCNLLEESNCEDDGDIYANRLQRYISAYNAARGVICQDYISSPLSNKSSQRSWEELDAISWAAFATSEDVKCDSLYRLHALDMTCIHNRLKFAMYWLNDVRFEIESTV